MALNVRIALLSLLFIAAGCSEKPYQWSIPNQFPEPEVPHDNPMSEAKVKLGRHLFYDVQLSGNQQQSCASCHLQQHAFAEPLTTSIGSTGERHRRNSQALVNVAYNRSLTWAHTGLSHIEQQLLLPIFGEQPVELGVTGHSEQVLNRFNNPLYNELFEEAFDDQTPSFDHIVKALASFVRSLISLDSPFDAYAYQMQDSALSESAKRGLNLFFSERLECHHCHGGFNFTQSSKHRDQPIDLNPFHNTGLYNEDEQGAYPASDTGLIEITQQQKDMGRFRAPTLRNIAVSAPYMHDGSIETLEQVIDFYADGGRRQGKASPLKSPFVKGFRLDEQEKADLLSFLHSLTDKNFLNNPDHQSPFTATSPPE